MENPSATTVQLLLMASTGQLSFAKISDYINTGFGNVKHLEDSPLKKENPLLKWIPGYSD